MQLRLPALQTCEAVGAPTSGGLCAPLLHPVPAYTGVKKTLWHLCACFLCGFTEATGFAKAVMHAIVDTPQVHSAMDCTKDDEFEPMDSNEAVRPSQHP